jgi:flagellin
VSFSINTNIASLSAQNYLRVNSDFQTKTINRVTSGLRIVSSGDDAAGLAIANGYRSDQAVLTQGVRNANDGLSTLQTIDGGINNISMLLDRARTLATQSASGTFTGGVSGRAVLNGEFQSVLSEISRQAQSIGLNQGGTFAANLAVFVGGGKGANNAAVISNGSVSVDLSKSTVDAQGLGLERLYLRLPSGCRRCRFWPL